MSILVGTIMASTFPSTHTNRPVRSSKKSDRFAREETTRASSPVQPSISGGGTGIRTPKPISTGRGRERVNHDSTFSSTGEGTGIRTPTPTSTDRASTSRVSISSAQQPFRGFNRRLVQVSEEWRDRLISDREIGVHGESEAVVEVVANEVFIYFPKC